VTEQTEDCTEEERQLTEKLETSQRLLELALGAAEGFRKDIKETIEDLDAIWVAKRLESK